ncbi:unnamed protein product, partial [Porites lobata]
TRCTTAKNKRERQRVGTLPLAMSMFRTEGMCGTEVDLLKEVQGRSVESDDSSESGGDGEEGDKAQVDNFSELDSKLERVALDVQPDMSSDNLVMKPGKANSGLDAEKAVNL